MKPKSTLRSFLAMAGSSLLTITYVSATPYYWDSDGDGTAGFGTAIGTWSSATPTNANKWSTSPTGNGVGGTATANVVTTDADDLFFGRGVNLRKVNTISGDATVTCESTTGLEVGMTVVSSGTVTTGTTVASITSPTEFELSANALLSTVSIQAGANFPYTGATTITGPVSAKSIYQSISAANFSGASQTINFAAVGSYESASANRAFATTTTLSGAATSMTWKVPYSSTCNITNITTNNAGQNIIEGPGRLGVTTMANLGVAGQGVVFKGGVLRFVNNFPCDTYPSVTAFNAVHPISFTLNEDAGFDNQNSNALRQTFTVDVPLTLGTGAFSVEGNGGANFILTNTGNNYTGATLLLGANLQISEAAHIGASTAPFYFNGNLKITGNTMTTLGTRSVVIRGGSTMKLNIDDASNVFTVGQNLTDNVAADGYALGAWADIAGICGVTKTGAGTLVLSGTNSYTAATTITAGKLSVGATSNLGASAANLVFNGGTLQITGTALTNFSTIGHTVSFTAATLVGLDIQNAAHTFTVDQVLNQTSGNFTKAGPGTVVLNQTNTYTGLTTIQGGTLIAGSSSPSAAAGAFGNAASEMSLGVAGGNNDASLLIGGAFTVGRNIRTATSDGTDAGTRVLTIGGNTANNSEFSGNIILGTADQALRGVTLTAASGGQVTFSGVIQNPGAFDATTYTVTKEGLGTVVLSNTNLYTGATAVNDGTLLVNGSLAAASAVSVNAGTLGGTGTISGAVTMGNSTGTADAILAPGTSIGAIATGNLAFNSDGRYACELNGTSVTSDQANVTGTVAIDAAATLTASLTGSLSPGQKYFIVVNDVADAVTGTFASLAQGAVVGNFGGTDLKISYTGDFGTSAIIGGNDIVLYTDAGGYASWKGANAGGQDPDVDFDNDGVDNGVEYFMNAVAGFTASPALNGSNTITWTNGGNILPAAYGTEYVIQTSSDLSTWTNVLVGALTTNTAGPGGSLTYTLTGASPRFVRLKVTPN